MPYCKTTIEQAMITVATMSGNGGAGGTYKGKSEMMNIVKIAKERDSIYITDMYIGKKMNLYRDDYVVASVEAKRKENLGITDLLPLDQHQMRDLATEETMRAISIIEDQRHKLDKELDRKYEELEAILELSNIDVIGVLVGARILSADHIAILPSKERVEWK